MVDFVKFFSDIDADNLDLVGGKGLRLAQMTDAGFLVPPGFCLTTRAYRCFIEENRLDNIIRSALFNLDYKYLKIVEIASKTITDAIHSASIPEQICEEIDKAYQKLVTDKQLVAVRSSAIAEDTSEASFAGQHETFLGIEGKEYLLDSIRKCWASLWTARVMQYRCRAGYRHQEAVLAVVVQQMVDCRSAGVLFTVNPIGNRADEIVINATWGLGESLVSGMVDADTIIVDKKDQKIKEYQIGQKQKTCKYIKGKGVVCENTGENAKEKCLDQDEIKELVQLARELEDREKHPQDIEWGIADGKLYLLQTRPVTTWFGEEQEEHWTADNAQEAIPIVVKPFTSSVIYPMVNNQTRVLAAFFGSNTTFDLVREFDGYAYLNVTGTKQFISDIDPCIDADGAVKQILGGGEQGRINYKISSLGNLYKMIKAMTKILFNIKRLPVKSSRFVYRYTLWLEQMSVKRFDLMPEPALNTLYRELMEYLEQGFYYHILGTMAYSSFYGALTEVLHTLPEEHRYSPSVFISGLGTLHDARLKYAVWKLSRAALADKKAKETIEQYHPECISRQLARVAGANFKTTHAEFLDEFGHMSDYLVEITAPRWHEDMSSIWKLVRHQMNYHENDPSKIDAQLTRQRQNAIIATRRYLSRGLRVFFPLANLRFSLLAKLARIYAPYRENLKFQVLKGISYGQKIALRWGEILREKGYWKNREDVFYLKYSEIQEALAGKITKEKATMLITARKQKIVQQQQNDPPHHIYVGKNKIRKVYDKVEVSGNQIKGVPGSAGRVTGKVRIIFELKDSDRLNPGEILVTRFTDPAWTPLFNLASAVVIDIGSILSHGAVVARELGIPAVIGVRCATEVLQDGMIITVDGDRGVVIIHEREISI